MLADFIICDPSGVILYDSPNSVYPAETSQQNTILIEFAKQKFIVCGRVEKNGVVMFVAPHGLVARPYWYGSKKRSDKRTDPLNPGRSIGVYLTARRTTTALHLGAGSASRGALTALERNGVGGFVLPEIDYEFETSGKTVSVYLKSSLLRKAEELGGGSASKGVQIALGDDPEREPKGDPGGLVCVSVNRFLLGAVEHAGCGSCSRGLRKILEAHGVSEIVTPSASDVNQYSRGRPVSVYLGYANMKKAKELGDGIASKGVRIAAEKYVERFAR